MLKPNVTVLICQSCIATNVQGCEFFSETRIVHDAVSRRYRKRLFKRPVRFFFVDCLGNCRNPNSVQIDREDGSLLYGRIQDEETFQAILDLGEKLNDTKTPLNDVQACAPNFIEYIPPTDWKSAKK